MNHHAITGDGIACRRAAAVVASGFTGNPTGNLKFWLSLSANFKLNPGGYLQCLHKSTTMMGTVALARARYAVHLVVHTALCSIITLACRVGHHSVQPSPMVPYYLLPGTQTYLTSQLLETSTPGPDAAQCQYWHGVVAVPHRNPFAHRDRSGGYPPLCSHLG
jgi:hypothetical protein